jgi:septal ring factor EnvC (AmiA/AmiB activator)
MYEVIKDILYSPIGSFTFVLGGMMLIAWLVYYITKFFTKISITHKFIVKEADKTKEDVLEIHKSISRIEGKQDNLTDRMDNFEKNMVDIKTDVNNIKTSLDKNTNSINEVKQILVTLKEDIITSQQEYA